MSDDVLETTQTFTPSLAKHEAIDSPSPLPPPVTNAFFPLILRSKVSILLHDMKWINHYLCVSRQQLFKNRSPVIDGRQQYTYVGKIKSGGSSNFDR